MRLRIGLLSLLSRLGKDENATVLVQFSVYLIAIMGMIGLATDGARFILLNSSLQDLADAAALAGAADLDGTSGARTRATNDAQAMANQNPARWYDVGGSTTISVAFYSAISTTGDTAATGDQDANIIKVTTDSGWQVAPTFLRAVGAISNNSTQASAWAQAATGSCKPLQLLLCNPQESASGSTTGDPSTEFTGLPGYMYHLKLKGGTGGYSPGDFNLLDPPGTNNPSAQALEQYLYQVNLGACSTDGSSPAPGQKTNPIANGINVRFDQPAGSSGDASTSAPIIIDGLSPTGGGGNNCNNPGSVTPPGFAQSDSGSAVATYDTPCTSGSGSCPLPRDRSFVTTGSANIGTGATLADLQAYWTNHHPGTLPTGVTTRYQIYQLEVAGTGNAGTWKTDIVEPHGPMCSAVTGNASRRIISAAIIDCVYWGVKGSSVSNIPTNFYGDFFITEPSPGPGSGTNAGTIYTELIATHKANTPGSALYRNVQLVR